MGESLQKKERGLKGRIMPRVGEIWCGYIDTKVVITKVRSSSLNSKIVSYQKMNNKDAYTAPIDFFLKIYNPSEYIKSKLYRLLVGDLNG